VWQQDVGTRERPRAPARLGGALARRRRPWSCETLSQRGRCPCVRCALSEVSPAGRRSDTARFGRRGGVYSYATKDGVRWRFVARRSDGTQTSKRGFTSERAARDARRRLIEQVEHGEVRHTKETFRSYWDRWLARRRPYLEAGTWAGYEIHGRKRLVPAFGRRPLGERSR
jgi:hypothetical protein